MDVQVKDTGKYGLGVFARRNFCQGEEIIEITGQVFDYDDIQEKSEIDRVAIQIGFRTYIGPSGGPDDYLNHSCDPNGGLQHEKGRWFLIAIRDIAVGEEITFDYSTSIAESNREMQCYCGSLHCRKVISDFRVLSQDLKQKYIRLGVVASLFITISRFCQLI